MDRIYQTLHPHDIPWNTEEPPQPLRVLIEANIISPCKTIDFGCGIGNNALYLAQKGFDVTGIDISPTAIAIAEDLAEKKHLTCRFIAADATADITSIIGAHETDLFEFAYDWNLLHHLFPDQREQYVKNVYAALKPQSPYLSVCFSEKDPHFGGTGKYRKTAIGTLLYFSSEKELRELFLPYFTIEIVKPIQIPGKIVTHHGLYVFMTKRKHKER